LCGRGGAGADGRRHIKVDAFDELAGGERCWFAAEAVDEREPNATGCSTGGDVISAVIGVFIDPEQDPGGDHHDDRVDGC